MARIFTLFEPSDTLARDCLVIFAIGVAYKLLFVAVFLARTANSSRAARRRPAAAPAARAPVDSDLEAAAPGRPGPGPRVTMTADAVWDHPDTVWDHPSGPDPAGRRPRLPGQPESDSE
jgi:hypothetical protein